jgi:hypothetical protein
MPKYYAMSILLVLLPRYAFLNSMYDGDAKEHQQENIIWNAVDDLVKQ